MKKIRSNIEALECSQHYTSNFSDVQGQITLVFVVVSSRNSNSFKLAFKHVLLTCKNEVDQRKMKELECSQDFSIISLLGFYQTLKGI